MINRWEQMRMDRAIAGWENMEPPCDEDEDPIEIDEEFEEEDETGF
jgi:hypothetical protein